METITFSATQSLYAQLSTYLSSHVKTLDNSLIIIPNDYLIRDIKNQIVQHGYTGILPTFTTLHNWLEPFYPNTLSTDQALLSLTDLIEGQTHLYGEGDAWSLATNLLALFNQLTLNGHKPNDRFEDFEQQLSIASQKIPDPTSDLAPSFKWLSKEAHIVYTIWQAWHLQMQESQYYDSMHAYTLALDAHEKSAHNYDHIIYIKPFKASIVEQKWLARQAQQCLVTQIDYESSGHQPEQHIAPCKNFEDHALSVAHCAAQAHKKGFKTLIIGEDRKLSRRIQAILNRQDIRIDDKSGWALSTTVVGACIEHWLNCIDNDFEHKAFLDVLHSNCINLQSVLDAHNLQQNQCIYVFEKDVILHENISHNLAHYKSALKRRLKRLDKPLHGHYLAITDLLEACEQAAQPLLELKKATHQPLSVYVCALIESLHAMGMQNTLAEDAAGEVINQLLEEHSQVAQYGLLPDMNWSRFRSWLNHTLEKTYFRPPATANSLIMATFEQAYFMEADFYIIAGVGNNTLPPKPSALPFFTHQAQMELGLESRAEFETRYQHVFERFLFAPSTCLLIWQTQQGDEHFELCNWLKQSVLKNQVVLHEITPLQSDSPPLSDPIIPYKKPNIQHIADLWPKTLSASAHQTLINHPYDFFVDYLLALKAEEEVSDALKKSNYGSRVHQCLERFQKELHTGKHPRLVPLTVDKKQDAIATLTHIGHEEFFKDINHYFENKAWFNRWLSILPSYIDWEIKQQSQARVQSLEHPILELIDNALSIKGRIDRMDKLDQGVELIDYKTGALPSKKDILEGENVQLTTYALCTDNVAQLSYIQLSEHTKVSSLKQTELEDTQIIERVKERLTTLHAQLSNEDSPASITSHCDHPSQVCRHPGLCRCQYWAQENKADENRH